MSEAAEIVSLDAPVAERELATGVPVIYRLNADSTVAEKVDLAS